MRELGNFDQESELEGTLLIAHPSLKDPNFHRSVIYLPAHDPEKGAMGLVINRPSGRVAADFLPNIELGILGEIPVFLGGPVGLNHMTFTSLSCEANDPALFFLTHLSLTEASDLANNKEHQLRAYLGYAGWSGGQLEAELSQKAWMVYAPTYEDLNFKDSKNIWAKLIGRFGPAYQLMAMAPDDPSMN